MAIERGPCGASLCLLLVTLAGACSSSQSPDNANAQAGSASGGAATATAGDSATVGGAVGASGSTSNQSGGAGTPAVGGSVNGGTAQGGNAGNASGGTDSDGKGGSAGAGGAAVTPAKFRSVGYLPSRHGPLTGWTSKLDSSLVTYVDACFATIDANGNISYSDTTLAAFVTAAHAKDIKVCVSLGGGGTNGGLGTLAALIAPAGRAAFVTKLTDYAVSQKLDCLDVDFEGAGVTADYEGFVVALGTSLKAQGKEMSAALAGWFGAQVTTKALQAFDFVNVMAYDLHNPAGKATPVQGSSLADSKVEIDYWVGRGLSKDKVVLGVPFYGYRWAPGATKGEAVTYAQLVTTYGAAADTDQIVKDGTTVYLNGTATMQAKAKLARDYGGIMAWELGQDATGDNSLLRALSTAP